MECRGRMKMTDDLYPARALAPAVPVMKLEGSVGKGIRQIDMATQLPVMIACDGHDLALLAHAVEQSAKRLCCRIVMHQISDEDELPRLKIGDQPEQSGPG